MTDTERINLALESKDSRELSRLSANPKWGIRYYVASNLHTGVETLTKMVHDDYVNIRLSLAGNPRTPIPVLVKLIEDNRSGLVTDWARANLKERDVLEDLLDDHG